uniref:TNF family profile domain-containing protein n=1 Tax=Neogobius melanostomus TaxID=47308 RepID=A0A8C6TTN8_9GOBI
MTQEGVMYPSVFTVDSYQTAPPPLPPRAGRRRPIGPTQVLLFLLVTVALCGMVVEAWLIYRLYNPPAAQVSVQYIVMKYAQTIGPAPTKWPRLVEAPSKPVAHLTDGTDLTHGKQVMAWSELADPLLYKVAYKMLKTKYYLGKNGIMLLSARPSLHSKQSNSFLAGVFHFYKDDAIFVKVSETSDVARGDPTQNVFGAYMI